MSSLNKCCFIGRIGKKPEIRQINNGKKVASFSIAVDESYKKDGEKIPKTEWVNIAVYSEGLIKVIENYADKGMLIYLEGKIKTDCYEKDGQKRYATKIVLQGFNSKLELLNKTENAANSNESQPQKEEYHEPLPNDEIPF